VTPAVFPASDKGPHFTPSHSEFRVRWIPTSISLQCFNSSAPSLIQGATAMQDTLRITYPFLQPSNIASLAAQADPKSSERLKSSTLILYLHFREHTVLVRVHYHSCEHNPSLTVYCSSVFYS